MIKTRLISLLHHDWKYVVLQVVWQWIALLCQIVIIDNMAGLIASAYIGSVTTQMAGAAFGLIAVCIAVRFLMDRLTSRAGFLASADVKRVLREKIYAKLLRLGASYREQTASSQVVQMATEGVEQLETYFGKYLSQFFYALLAPVTLFLVLMRINLRAALVLLCAVPLIPIVIMVVMIVARKLLDKYFNIYYGLGDSFLEKLQGLTTLKVYEADEEAAQEMDLENEKFRRITMKVLSMQLNSTAIMDIVAYGGAAIGMVTALSEFSAGAVSLKGTLMIILLGAEFFLPMRLLGSYFHIGMNGMKAADRIFAFLDLEEPATDGTDIRGAAVSFEMQHVTFSYDGKQQVLENVCLRAAPGAFVSIVGPSGSGKSTIAALLSGKRRQFEGRITVNDVPIGEISERSLLDHVVVVGHNSYLFKGTIRDNLQMGRPDASDDDMLRVLAEVQLLEELAQKAGQADHLAGSVRQTDGRTMQTKGEGRGSFFASNKEHGKEKKSLPDPEGQGNQLSVLDLALDEGAGNLSGGQRQRLALARALLFDAPAYIFDEATSNIDMESEEMILRVIHKLAKTKTVILISHRLANVVTSDVIYMLEHGKIREHGTHTQLMAKGGAYAKLFSAQQELESYARGSEPTDRITKGMNGARLKRVPASKASPIVKGSVSMTASAFVPDEGTAIPAASASAPNEQPAISERISGKRKSSPAPSSSGRAPKGRYSALAIMRRLIVLVKPLTGVMCLGILLGVAGFLCAIFLTILAGEDVVQLLATLPGYSKFPGKAVLSDGSFLFGSGLVTAMLVIAFARGFLHYGEQYCNHYIAFRILAIIRHKVFAALRKLCPAKLEGKDKGNLISLITSDIELLEVFYAHTISPICIAVLVCLIMVIFIGRIRIEGGFIAAAGYLVVGVLIPLWNGRRGSKVGLAFRNSFGDLGSYVLDSLYGLDETIQFGTGEKTLKEMDLRSRELGTLQKEMNRYEASQRSLTNLAIESFSLLMLAMMLGSFLDGACCFETMVLSVVAMMGSFGPVTALSNLSNSLTQTLASGERVLSLLDEEPVVEEVSGRKDISFHGIQVEGVSFAYAQPADGHGGKNTGGNGLSENESLLDNAPAEGTQRRKPLQAALPASRPGNGGKQESSKPDTDAINIIGAANKPDAEENMVLSDFSASFPAGKIIGIHGRSGCGKSTLLKLLMRFWDVQEGSIEFPTGAHANQAAEKERSAGSYANSQNVAVDIRNLNTRNLREMESYVMQETWLFHDSIARNIAVGRKDASREEIEDAAKKASIHDYIMSLPKGYDTMIGELGDGLSGGERQRIGLARAFLHDSDLILLDEPTSNLDSLNEGIILRSLKEAMRESTGSRTIIIVSHRQSTMSIVDELYEME